MMDLDAFQSISGVLSDADDARRGGITGGSRVDSTGLGDVHMLLFGDMKQLPPATGKAPFVVLPLVQTFDFRVLRQNRRVVQDEARREEIELFHTILTDISHCEPTKSVRDFIIGAYLRGASVGTAEHSPLEGNTAVFTKRRYRDAWNRCVTRRISKSHNHTVKIKAKVRARGQRGQNWYSDRRVSFLRSKCRTQNSWLLHLAGDHHASFETKPLLHRPHLMRCMLTSKLAVDQRFANGTCYHVQFAGKTRCHEIEHPIICHECNVLPASLRSQSQAVAAPTTHWTCWCYYCYERQPHGDVPHKLHDLDSDSDSDESDQEEDHASIRSFSTWQKEDCALSCTSWPKDDDATSNATSNASFKLSWERVEVEDDSMSHSSFQMVGGNTSNADDAGFGSEMGIGDNTSSADDAELEEQQQQEQQQQQQQQQHIQSPTEQQLQQQQQQQHKPQADLGAWLCAWELDLAIAMSLRDASGFDKATSSSSSISRQQQQQQQFISSSNCSSSSVAEEQKGAQ